MGQADDQVVINRAQFIRDVKASLKLTSRASTTLNAILDEWERRRLTDQRWLAYMCSTILGECGPNMLPVREGFKRTDAEARAYVKRQGYRYAKVVNGNVYYGRGLVQLTWDSNYRDMTRILGIDLYNDPDQALRPDVAVKILFEGMIRGTFSGKKLSDYFSARKNDPLNARRIINGTDKAAKFKGFHSKFLSAIQASSTGAPALSLVDVGQVRSKTADAPKIPQEGLSEEIPTPPDGDPEVFLVQKRLKQMGYNPGGTDGRWGGMTAGAIAGFNNDRGRKVQPKIDDVFKAELTKAEAEGFTRPIATERANPTDAKLAEKAPEIVTAKKNRLTGLLSALAAFSLAVLDGIMRFFKDALEWLTPVKEFASDVPSWAWLLVASGVAAFIYHNSRKGVAKITESVQTGERA